MKRIVVCCDGTWNTPDQNEEGIPRPTNVSKLALAVSPEDPSGAKQRIFYETGVGTGLMDRVQGGIFGSGISKKIQNAYGFLIANFEPGDELYLFGFSRGAYCVRSLAGLVRNSGILRVEYAGKIAEAYSLYRRREKSSHPRRTESELFRRSFSHETRIKLIGVWDTVGALGIPGGFRRMLNWWNQFHDVELSTRVEHAYHAVAIDERRKAFAPTLWKKQRDAPSEQVLEQVWFAGVHSDVGGGYAEAGLSDIALLWMIRKAELAGLHFDLGRLQQAGVSPNALGMLHESQTGLFRVLPQETRSMGSSGPEEAASDTAVARRRDRGDYRPRNLDRFVAEAPHRIFPVSRLISPP